VGNGGGEGLDGKRVKIYEGRGRGTEPPIKARGGQKTGEVAEKEPSRKKKKLGNLPSKKKEEGTRIGHRRSQTVGYKGEK